jgi:putative ABC transport system permease protein
MLFHYYKIALRQIRNQKGYTFINVTGLALGLTCCLLIGLYVQQERSYDIYHLNKDRVYRLVRNDDYGSGISNNALTSAPVGPALELAFPEVETAVRFFNPGVLGNPVVRTGDRQFTEEKFVFTDPEVLVCSHFRL